MLEVFRFKQKFANLSNPHGLDQIVKWAMLSSPSAAAVLFAACEILLNTRGTKNVSGNSKRAENVGFELLQSSGRQLSKINYLSHICG